MLRGTVKHGGRKMHIEVKIENEEVVIQIPKNCERNNLTHMIRFGDLKEKPVYMDGVITNHTHEVDDADVQIGSVLELVKISGGWIEVEVIDIKDDAIYTKVVANVPAF